MKKTIGFAGMLVVLMSGCGPADTEAEQPPDAIQLGQQKAEIGPGQGWLLTYYSDASKTRAIGYYDYCGDYGWGQTSPYTTMTIVTCVGGAL